MNAMSKQMEILHLLRNRNPSFLGILENKLSMESIDRFMGKINNNWKHAHNIFNGQKSRIFILWDSSQWSNIILHTSDQFIFCILHNVNGVSLLCTTVYAFNDEAKRMDLWNYIVEQSININLP